MPIDTRNKRVSLISLGQVCRPTAPEPSGGFDTAMERAMLLFRYGATLALTGGAFAPEGFDNAGFWTGEVVGDPPPPPPPPPVGETMPEPVLVYYPDVDELELVDRWSPKVRRGSSYRGRRRYYG